MATPHVCFLVSILALTVELSPHPIFARGISAPAPSRVSIQHGGAMQLMRKEERRPRTEALNSAPDLGGTTALHGKSGVVAANFRSAQIDATGTSLSQVSGEDTDREDGSFDSDLDVARLAERGSSATNGVKVSDDDGHDANHGVHKNDVSASAAMSEVRGHDQESDDTTDTKSANIDERADDGILGSGNDRRDATDEVKVDFIHGPPGGDDSEGDEEEHASLLQDAVLEGSLPHFLKLVDADADGRASIPELVGYAVAAHQRSQELLAENALLRMDGDHDGRINLQELYNYATNPESEFTYEVELAKFRAADKNHDGLLDRSEVPAIIDATMEPHVRAAEVQAEARLSLEALDTNADEHLSWSELAALHGDTPDRQHLSLEEERKVFKANDHDGDGRLSLLEFIGFRQHGLGPTSIESHEATHDMVAAPLTRLLTKIDTDADGYIGAREIMHAHVEGPGSSAGDAAIWHMISELSELEGPPDGVL